MFARLSRAGTAPVAARALRGALAIAVALAAAVPAAAQMPSVAMRDGMPTLAPLVDKVTPACVNIAVRSKAEAPDMSEIPQDLRRFFQLPDEDQERPRERNVTAVGSGVIIDAKKGYIVTNHHVIDKATEVVVTLKDRRELTAKIIGSDERTDVALLQVDAKDLTALPIGDSTDLKVGDYVMAVGDPFGLGPTVTSGIVSAVGRSSLNLEDYEDFIQTDASINPGNSGGALVNLKGELVGINTAILGPAGGSVGIGFAIPSAMVSAVVAQIEEHGTVSHGLIGIQIQDLTPDVAKNLGLDVSEGALVSQVVKGSPADQAGVKAGDVVTTLDGKPLHSMMELRNRIGLMPVGTQVTLGVDRDGRKMDIKVAIGKSQQEEMAALTTSTAPALEGATFDDGTAGDKSHGVRVSTVEKGSPAEQVGIKAGDLIVAVNRQPVNSVDEFNDALKGSSRSAVLKLKRGDEDLVLPLP